VNDWLEIWATLWAYLGLAAFGALVLAGLWMFTASLRPPWLLMQRVRPISWQGADVFMAFLIAGIIPILVGETLRKAGIFESLYGVQSDPSMRGREELWTFVMSTPLVLGLIILGLHQLRGTRLAELGLTPARAGNNFAIGYLLWLMITPAALVIYSFALFATPESWIEEHPISRAADQPLAISEWALLLIGTTVFAPLVEELIFRGLLLAWQLRHGWPAQWIVLLCSVIFAAVAGERLEDKPFNPAPVIFVGAMLPVVLLVPSLLRYRRLPDPQLSSSSLELISVAPVDVDSHVQLGHPCAELPRHPAISTAAERIERKLAGLLRSATDSRQSPPASAILINGLFFAAMHSTIWPSPIPLFVLGTGLAWVTYRTSSLVGAITLHALFNSVAALTLLLKHLWT
jgi:membrane protease YdiL (CAAX protease family)